MSMTIYHPAFSLLQPKNKGPYQHPLKYVVGQTEVQLYVCYLLATNDAFKIPMPQTGLDITGVETQTSFPWVCWGFACPMQNCSWQDICLKPILVLSSFSSWDEIQWGHHL